MAHFYQIGPQECLPPRQDPLGQQVEYGLKPFRLTNAPAVFQALVNDDLRDMLNKFLFVYIDDILIFSETEEEHVQHVRLVLR